MNQPVMSVEAAPEYEYSFQILPPISESGTTGWYGVIEREGRPLWQRRYAGPIALMRAAAEILVRQVDWERREGPKGRPPLGLGNALDPIPNVPAQWRVTVSASCREEQPEWSLLMHDDASWGTSGYDLSALLGKLATRMVAANVPPQPFLSEAQPSAPTQFKVASPESGPVASFPEYVGKLIATLDQRIASVESQLPGLKSERTALRAALSAYRTRTKEKKAKRAIVALREEAS